MVAVDAVQPQGHQAVDLTTVLGIPSETGQAQPPKQGHQAAGPFRLGKVHRVHASRRQVHRVALKGGIDPLHPCGVHEPYPMVEIPPGGQERMVGMAEPESPGVADLGCPGDRRSGRRRVLDVEGHGHVGSDLGQKFSQCRNVVGQVGGVDRRDGLPSWPSPDPSVMVEHRYAVDRAPHIALQTGGSEAHGQPKGLEGVLRCVGAPTAVGEENGSGGVHRAIMAGIGASPGDA